MIVVLLFTEKDFNHPRTANDNPGDEGAACT